MEMKLSRNISLDLLSKIHNNEDSFSEDGRIEKNSYSTSGIKIYNISL